jgi:thymidine kinase
MYYIKAGIIKMSKLYFFYGAMGATKTANLLTTHYNYIEKNMDAIIFTSHLDTRGGAFTKDEVTGVDVAAIGSRIKFLNGKGYVIYPEDNIVDLYKLIVLRKKIRPSVILVDEASFLQRHHIDELSDLVDFEKVNVMCYGLRTDFMTESFEGSARLLEIADNIEEIKTMCHCGEKAIINARVVENKIVKEGEKIMIGGNESYVSLCRKCYKLGDLYIAE